MLQNTDMNLASLLHTDKTLGRSPYALWGIGLALVKYNIDRLIAGIFFNRGWRPTDYLAPRGTAGFDAFTADDIRFYLALIALAVPFIAVGVLLTFRRLRDAGLTSWLVLLFFLPFVNLLFFALLCLLPTDSAEQDREGAGLFTRVIPNSNLGSALLGCGISVAFGAILVLLSVDYFTRYGWGLFVGLPFMSALFSVIIYCYREPRTLPSCIAVGVLPVLLLGALLFGLAIEGIICLVMAAPLAVLEALIGSLVGYAIAAAIGPFAGSAVSHCYFLVLPLLLLGEAQLTLHPPQYQVESSLVITAPPEVVWKHVVSFSELPPPSDWLFQTGLAYPMRARIEGEGVGAIRYCEFSTGAFVEPIEVWDPPHHLAFSVRSSPPPMEEWSIYASVNPPHLHGFLESQRGAFRLEALPDGSTILSGTTVYTHRMWPGIYWRLFSDTIISRIHLRVLKHIKRLAESESV